METVKLIVECTMDEEREKLIESIGVVRYRLPMIHSYVVEVPESSVCKLTALQGVRTVHLDTCVMAQMNSARKSINVEKLQTMGCNGRGSTIAILDTGISPVDDLTKPRNRIVGFKDFVNGRQEPYDDNGHGTHVAGIAAGNGLQSSGKYMGVAPEANILSVKILDASGRGNAADVLAGLQWIMDNKERYNVRIANLSIGTVDIGVRDPLVKAVEKAWDGGIVMVIAAGNSGPGVGSVTSPGISRKVITVGASDDNRSVQIWGDTLENYSGRGPTSECIMKPDVVAPGADIVSCMASSMTKSKRRLIKAEIVSEHYMQMSGTSMSTPMISGAVALLLQNNPSLTPDEVKYRLKRSSMNLNYPQNQQGWGLIDVEKLVRL